nr:MAG TPA: hypothetical protein [Caudoviricetes sp.]
MSPRPPKEKRGGIPISPRTPLKRHKGAELRFLPFGNPSFGGGDGAAALSLWKPSPIGRETGESPLETPP